MNRHERRRARKMEAFETKARAAYADPEQRERYNRDAGKFWTFFRYMLEHLPAEDPPRFALLPKDLGLAASLAEIGTKLTRNYTAEILLSALLNFAAMSEMPTPTYMMLRAFVEQAGLATDTVSLDELGIEVATIGGKGGLN
jgi:hypothetical protein